MNVKGIFSLKETARSRIKNTPQYVIVETTGVEEGEEGEEEEKMVRVGGDLRRDSAGTEEEDRKEADLMAVA